VKAVNSAASTDHGASRSAAARAASAPAATLPGTCPKSMNCTPVRSGVISTSRALSSRRDRWTFCSVRMLSICWAMPSALLSVSRPPSGVPRFTAMTTSAPSSRASCTGRLLTSPPSPSTRPSTVIGAKAPGTAIEARIAVNSETPTGTTMSPDSMSVATAR